MTGVDGRPEVVFEGTNGDPEKDEWRVNQMPFMHFPVTMYNMCMHVHAYYVHHCTVHMHH